VEAVVADPTPSDRPVQSTNGRIEAHQQDDVPAPAPLEDEQTLADRDETLADRDQTAADGDQTAADSDQAAADSDQAASDRDLTNGGDPDEHDATREIRDRSAQQRQDSGRQREESGQQRVNAAAARDVVAHARDLSALARDEAATLRDHKFAARDAAWAGDGRPAVTGPELVLRSEESRRSAAFDRAVALGGRVQAAADRERASRDREQAARDRVQASADRDALLDALAIAETDSLTGAHSRAAGLADLDHEIARARRATGALVIAYVDVVGLKVVNDEHGHAIGDALLQRAVQAIHGQMRSYDLIVRLGGDEFLCVMSGATIHDARQRFGDVQTSLAADPDPCEIRVGFAALAPEDTADELIERADADLPAGSGR
jgi:diguanylate cyclase (GGDEF)-like protein